MLMDRIRIEGTVKQYPYRTARVFERFFEIPRDQVRQLEEQLADAAGVRMDNHTVYEITSEDGNVMYIWFHDLSAYFGSKLIKDR